MQTPEFCWICGKHWREHDKFSAWFFSDGPFGYGICKKCFPLWEVVLPIAGDVLTRIEEPAHRADRAMCIACGTFEYEGRSLHNHPRCIGVGRSDDWAVCGACRGPLDEARHAAQEVERATRT